MKPKPQPLTPGLNPYYGWIARACGVSIFILGALVTLAWYCNYAPLIRILPGTYTAMQYLTAAGFVLGGAALFSAAIGRWRISQGCALILMLSGTLVLGDHLLSSQGPLSGLLSWLPEADGVGKNIPSLPASIGFSVCGLALAARGSRLPAGLRKPLTWALAAFALTCAVMALSGYTTILSHTPSWESFSGMAIHTALGISIFAIGILALQAGEVAPIKDPALPLPVGVVILTTSVILWHALLISESELGRLPHLIGVFGLLLAIGAMIAIRAIQKAAWLASASAHANKDLEDEIKGRKLVENKLRESEERIRLVLDAATDVSVITCNPSGRISYFSKGSEKILGYSAQKMTRKADLIDLHDMEEISAYGEKISRMLHRSIRGFDVLVTMPKAEGSERREWNYLCQDGTRKIMDSTLSVMRNDSGQITGYLATAIDISEPKQMEARLRQLVQGEQTARGLLEAAGRMARMGHWEALFAGGTMTWSPMVYDIHDLPPDTFVSLQEGINYYHADDQAMVERMVTRTLQTGTPFDFEARIITAKGRQIWVHSLGEAIRDERGKIIGMRGIFQDVNERHKAAGLLAEKNRQLEAATAEALAYAKSKAEFLANMSHEIRTPLNAIIGMTDLLSQEVTDQQTRGFVETIRSGGDVLLALINDILDFSKIEAGKLDLESIAVDLHECVESSLDLVASQASRKQLDLLYWIDPEVPAFALGDLTRLRQILVNLLTNGVKFTPAGDIFIRVTMSRTADRGKQLCFSVRDTGIGIPLEQQRHLFQAFTQGDSSTTRRFGGTGLGLAICHRLVEMMKGRIWVDSQAGKGANFQFEVPFQSVQQPNPPVYERGALPDLKGLRALIVDDNDTNRWILREHLAAWGMVSHESGLPLKALEWIRRGDAFDLVILDVHMPEMDGYQLAGEIRKVRSETQLPILMLTSMADRMADRNSLGITGHLTKPVKTAALFDAICRLVLGPRVYRAAPHFAKQKNQSDAHPLRILIAEDNPINQRVIKVLMERLGYSPALVENGQEVLEIMASHAFDVILMDVHMPEMDGRTATKRLRATLSSSGQPYIIALTADAGIEDKTRCLEAGMDAYLSKPIRLSDLAEALRLASQARARKA